MFLPLCVLDWPDVWAALTRWHRGGGMTRVDGEFSQTADQSSDSSVVQSMTRNMEQDVPLVLILGKFSARDLEL